MSIVDWLRKGFGYVLLSMGVSRPAAKAVPRPRQESKPTSEPDTASAPDGESDGPSN